ncbi:Dicarboxylic amino acid permease [Cyberlindnera fabianii]|uniref:Dicarboxylic amino acid permease n=1 Tax=Cyberlindnera fabianii TaxID=36022 RepID=A0A1V2LDP0_CYBFA|nr:Dicarboxylic amino acid permease [Cyberlindnera fabianii]
MSFTDKKSPQDSNDKVFIDVEANSIEEYAISDSVGITDAERAMLATKDGYRLKKGFKARHLSMIAIGGALGTGLLIGSGAALSSAGPANLLIAYTFIGLLVYTVMCSLAEMATYIPLPDGFAGYAHRYVDEALGFSLGWCYLIKFWIGTANQITAGAMVMQYWVSRDLVNPGVWITMFIIIIVFINVFGVKVFGEFEFILSSVKVVIVLGVIVLMICIALGGSPTHDRLGFRYWQEPGAFKPYPGIADESKAKFVSFAQVLVTAVFSYGGTELIGVTLGEAQNPRRNVPKAIRLTFYRIVIFYVLAVFFLGMCVPYNDPLLIDATKASTSANASPFVVAIKNARITGLDHLMNVCILVFIFSASNSDLYIGTRTLYGLAINGNAPKLFAKTNKWGIPYYSLILSTAFCALAYMSCVSSSQTVFGYFVNVTSLFGLITWICILVIHIYFVKALEVQGIDRNTLAYKAPWHPYSTYIALFFAVLVAIIKNFTVFINGFNYKSFITGYIAAPTFFFLWAGYKLVHKTKVRKPEDVDLISLKHFIDEEEEQGKIEEAERRERLKHKTSIFDREWFYEKFVSWLF